MKKYESDAQRFVRLLGERLHRITSSPEKSTQFLIDIGLITPEEAIKYRKKPAKETALATK